MTSYTRDFPRGTKRITTGCQYCAVGCGYNAFLVPEDADPAVTDEFDGVSAFITPAMRGKVRYKGGSYLAAVAPDARCDLNKGNHSVRGGTQGANLVTPDGSGRSTEDRLISPQVRLASGELVEITWDVLNQVMARLVAFTTEMTLTGRGRNRQLQVGRPAALGAKVYEYQYLENTFAATQLFYSLVGTPNIAYHDRPSAADSGPGLQDAGFRPHDFAYEDLADADVVLILGTNPYENQSVFFMQHLVGRQLIVVDPRRTATARYAVETGGLHVQPSRLGADSLLLYAMAREVLERYEAEHGTLEMPLRLEIGDPAHLLAKAEASDPLTTAGTSARRRASRATDLAGFRRFLGFENGDPTYTLANAENEAGLGPGTLAEVVSRLFTPHVDPERRPKVSILYEKGLIWGFNYHNTAAVASLGVLLGAVDGDGRLTGRVGGHQKGWAESLESLGGVAGSNGEGYPLRHASDTYSDEFLRTILPAEPSIKPHHNLDNHLFGPPEDQVETRHDDGRVTLSNGLTTLDHPDVNLLWIIGGNYLGQTNDSERKRRILERRLAVGGAAGEVLRPTSAEPEEIFEVLEARIAAGGLVVVHQEIFPNPTTELADLVIPATGWGEDSFCRYNGQRRLKLYERFQDMPLHDQDRDRVGDDDPFEHREAFDKSPKPDWMIFRDIARAVGQQVDAASGSGDFASRLCARAFPWRQSFEVADAMAALSNRGQASSQRSGQQSMLGDLLPFAESRRLDPSKGLLHSLLGQSGDGDLNALAEHLTNGYSVPASSSRVHGNGIASNGVLLPAVGVAGAAGEITAIEGTLRVSRRGQPGGFFFVRAPWTEIEQAFGRINDVSGDPGEVILTNGRFNHLWNNMFHHLRNETVNERYPEDLPGTVLEVNPAWADDRGLGNGQVVDITAGDSSLRAIVSRQSSVAPGHAFAMFSYPVREGGRFRFSGYVNNVTDGHTDGLNPIAALKYGRAVVTAAPHPESGEAWIYQSATRLGPSYEQRNRIVDPSRFDPRGTGPPPPAPTPWNRRQRLDWQMRELIVTKGVPRAFLSEHRAAGASADILDPDRFISRLAGDESERSFFIDALPFMSWPRNGLPIDHWRNDEIAFVKERWNSMDILEIRLLPPLAIGRFGSSPEPMHNYDLLPPEDGAPHRRLVPAPTLVVEHGRVVAEQTPEAMAFRDADGRIKPVSPFLELWVRTSDGGPLEPLTAGILEAAGLAPPDISWRVDVANLKAFRRTGDANDRIEASTGDFSDHDVKPLEGRCPVFKPGKSLPFGQVQFIEPSDGFEGLRLRFVPAAGKVYGPSASDPNLADDVYDAVIGNWDNHADGDVGTPPMTVPGGIYRGRFNSQTERLVSEGYLDDACDGVVRASLEIDGRVLETMARITSGPPDFAPDSLHVRSLQDDLEQMLRGPDVTDDVPWGEVTDLLRRAFETVSLMETRVMNGTQGVGGVVQNINNMAAHDAATGRAFEPIFDDAAPGLTDPAAVAAFHRAALASLEAGNLPNFLGLLRGFDQAHDLTAGSRRRMPAMMRGSDGGHLVLTRRQRDKVRAAAEDQVIDRPGQDPGGELSAEEEMEILIRHFESRAGSHMHLATGDGGQVGSLFTDPAALLDFLRGAEAQGFSAGPEAGRPLVVPGDPDQSAFVRLLRRPGHPMNIPFSRTVPGTERTGFEIVERWITSLA